MIPYARQSINEDDETAVLEVLRSDFLTQGPIVPKFENVVAAHCGAQYAVAVSNATSALHLAARALGLREGGLLWTSPISFVASSNCALYCGADVDFVDIDSRTLNISTGHLQEKLERANADGRLPDIVVIVDFAGRPCQLSEIAQLARKYGFRIVEDASHAIGAEYQGEPVGNGRYADVTVFSFHPVKIITTGEGGMAVTNDDNVAETMRLLRSHGITRDLGRMTQPREPWEYEQLDLGFNYRLTEIQAALGAAQMERIATFIEKRQRIAAGYGEGLASAPLVLPSQPADARSAYHLYPVQMTDDAPCTRRDLYDRLRSRGVAANVHYMPIYLQPYYQKFGFGAGYCPNAEDYYRRALSLPMYAGLSDAEHARVIDAVLECLV
jgi:UDP-4-amino-4,6-dideoxy-N-acetyl-beta-L-altrosamine transaminase